MSPPIVLSIAGSDCSAGAGIQADLKAIEANGAFALTAVTCVVAETPGNVAAIEVMPTKLVGEQVRMLLDAYPVAAVKTGLLASAAIADEVSMQLANVEAPIVVDPVAVASTGDDLTQSGFAESIVNFIRDRATLLTPNRGEAQQLLGDEIEDGREAALRLANMLGCAVLLKGGHFEGDESIDWLAAGDENEAIRAPRIDGLDVHGTGCAYSSAIAARLANGEDLIDAVRQARAYLHEALVNHHQWGELKALANPANVGQVAE